MVNTKSIMRHIATVLAIFGAIFFLSSCGGPSPTDSADTFLQAIKTQDAEKLASIYSSGELDLLDAASSSDDSESEEAVDEAGDGLTQVYEEQLVPKMLDFDYELSNEQVDGDKATVDVKFTTYRIGDAFTSFFSEYISQAFILAFSDTSEEEMDALAASLLAGKIADLTEKSYEKTATISLTKVDGKWMVDDVQGNKDVIDGITGGLLSSFSSMESAFSAWEEEE